MESSEDNLVGEEGKTRKLVCGTEKGQHKCKNYRTAGTSVLYCNITTHMYVTGFVKTFLLTMPLFVQSVDVRNIFYKAQKHKGLFMLLISLSRNGLSAYKPT